MLRQPLPTAASRYAQAQRREIRSAVAAAVSLWGRMGVDFDPSWVRIQPQLLTVVETAQRRVAAGAQAYIPDVLEDTGQVRAAAAFAEANAAPLVGLAGDGRSLDGLLYGAVTHSKERVAVAALSPAQALRSGRSWLAQAVGTALSDTGRQSESLAMGVRPVSGYVRMLNPPSCSRCVILAGRWYPKSAGFQRHPRCDCRHIPSAESNGTDLTVNPQAYLDSLTDAEQDALLGKAGAEAVRNGADLNQVVNARRGMRPAQIGGRNVLITTESTTRRGLSSRAATGRAGARLMPETIAQVARDRDDYLRLLRVNGYLR